MSSRLLQTLLLAICLFLTITCFADNRYWVGGTGSWTQTAHWSLTSGGAGGASVPTSSDNVIINTASGSSFIITYDGSPTFNNLVSTGSNNFVLFGSASVTVTVLGSLEIGATTSHTFGGTYNFASSNTGNTITLNNVGNSTAARLLFSGSGTWTFLTNINNSNNIIEQNNGTLIANNKTIVAKEYKSVLNVLHNLDITNSTLNLTQYFTGSPSLNFIGTNSVINFTSNISELRSCIGVSFNMINFTATSNVATNYGKVDNTNDNCTFAKIRFNHHGFVLGNHMIDTISIFSGKTLSLGANNTQHINNFSINGSCLYSFTTLQSTLAGTRATISNMGTSVDLDHMNIRDINAIGGATYTSYNTNDLGNNLGWNIQNGRNLYWVGGSGSWKESSHWSLTSGGPGGECLPLEYDNVFIDENSFTSNGTINIREPNIIYKMNNLHAGDNDNLVMISVDSTGIVEIFGDIIANSNLTIFDFNPIYATSKLILKANTTAASPKIIDSNNCIFSIKTEINGPGSHYELLSDFISIDNILLISGSIKTNAHDFNLGSFTMSSGTELNMSTSNATIQNSFIQNAGSTLIQSGSNFIFQSTMAGSINVQNQILDTLIFYSENSTFNGNNNTVNYIKQIGVSGKLNIGALTSTFKKVECYNDFRNIQSTLIDTLILYPATRCTLNNLTIVDSLRAESNCGMGQILLQGNTPTVNALLSSKAIHVSGCIITGFKFSQLAGVGSMTAISSSNFGGNTNVQFTNNTSRTLYWVNGEGDWIDDWHWSNSSGGSPNECIPTQLDTVIFDNNSGFITGNDSIFLNSNLIYCKDVICLNTVGPVIKFHTYSSSFKFNIKGNFTGSPNSRFGTLTFNKTNGSSNFIQNGSQISTINIDSTLIFNVIDSINISALSLTAGTFDSNTNKVKLNSLNGSNASTVCILDSSYVEVFGISVPGINLSAIRTYFNIIGTSFNVGANRNLWKVVFDQNNVTLSMTASQVEYIEVGTLIATGSSNLTFGSISPETNTNLDSYIKRLKLNGGATINGRGTKFDTLDFAPAKTYLFSPTGSEPDTILHWNSTSSCALGNTFIKSVAAGTQAKLKILQAITVTNASIQDINIIDNGLLTAGNSTDLGNNTNITFGNTPRTLYWVGNSGNWNDASHWSTTSGGAGGECIPTAVDNVFFNASSFTISNQTLSLPAIGFCNNMNWENVANSPNFSLGYALNIYGSVVLGQNMGMISGAEFQLRSTNPQTILSNNKISNIPWSVFGNYICMDNFNTTLDITMNSGGNLTAFPGSISCRIFNGNAGSMVNIEYSELTLKSKLLINSSCTFLTSNSEINFSNGGIYQLTATSVSFHNVQVLNSTVLPAYPDDGFSLTCAGCTFNKLNISSNGTFFYTFAVDTLVLSPGFRFNFKNSIVCTVNEKFEANGNCSSAGSYIELLGPISGVKPKINSLIAINLNLAKIRNIDADGVVPFTCTNCIDLTNNVDIDFITPVSRNLYWVAGTGNWYDASHWSLESGGTGGECPPNNYDNIFFNALSFTGNNQTVSAYTTPFCKDMDWSGSGVKSPDFRFYESMYIHGNAIFEQNISILGLTVSNISQPIIFTGSGTNSIYSNGYTIPSSNINGTGTWNAMDAFNISALNMIQGTFNSNDQQLNIGNFIGNTTTAGTNSILNLGSSIVMTSSFNVASPSNLSINSGTSKIRFSTVGSFVGGTNITYNEVEFLSTTATATISGFGNTTINSLKLFGNGNFSGSFMMNYLELSGGKTYNFSSNQIYYINNIIASGSCTVPIIIKSGGSTAASAAKFSKANGLFYVQNATLTNINGVGGATFQAYNSTGTNTPGWTIIPGPNASLYWVGNQGSWGDEGHWAYTSGGTGGACLPSPSNDVIFDENSFDILNRTVDINLDASCKNMTWTSNKRPILSGNPIKFLKIYGSVELDSFMTSSFMGNMQLEAVSSAQSFKSKSATLDGPLYVLGAGSTWDLLDSIHVNNIISHLNGTLNTNGHKLTANKFVSNNTNNRSINFGSSVIELLNDGTPWEITNTGLSFNAGISTLYFSGSNVNFIPLSNFTYYNVIGNRSNVVGNMSIVNSNNVQFNNVTFNQNGLINGSHSYNEIIAQGGSTLTLESGSTQNIIGNLILNSSPNDTIIINASIDGVKAFIDLPATSFCFSELNIKDNEIINGLAPHAIKSREIGNTTNWDFTNYVFYMDNDGDSFGDTLTRDTLCLLMPGYVTNGSDCNDNDSLEFPGQIWFEDLDQDDHGAELIVQCTRPPSAFVTSELSTTGDCNDNNPNIHPFALEICDGTSTDEDCDGSIDEGHILTNIFVGVAGSTDWSDPANWSAGVLPTYCHDVIISSNDTVIVGITNAVARSLHIYPNAEMQVDLNMMLELYFGNGTFTLYNQNVLDIIGTVRVLRLP